MVDTRCLAPSQRLPFVIPTPSTHTTLKKEILNDWRLIDSLKLLNIHYDVTPSKFITMIACDLGLMPPTSCLSILRESDAKESEK